MRGLNRWGSSLTQKLSDSAEETPVAQRKAGQELAPRGGWPGTRVPHEGLRHASCSSPAGSRHPSGLSARPSPPPRRPLICPPPSNPGWVRDPSSGTPAPMLPPSEHLPPCLASILPGDTWTVEYPVKTRGSEVGHTTGPDLPSLSFCFLLGQMRMLMTFTTLGGCRE